VTEDQLRRLRDAYETLGRHQRRLESSGAEVDYGTFAPIAETLTHVEAEFPDLLPAFRPEHFVAGHTGPDRTFSAGAIRGHLAAVLGKLRPLVDRRRPVAPAPEALSFPFVADPRVRAVVERDYLEIQRACGAGCWKSAILLAGGVLEAVLVDRLRRDGDRARGADSAPAEPDPGQWSLGEVIGVAVELEILKPYLEINIGDATRAYRTLVRPEGEARSGIVVGEDEARAVLTVLEVLHRDLSKVSEPPVAE
jgi:hypothetical protein